MANIILTGIKPTGDPHLGNYLGAIKPALAMAHNNPNDQKYFFIADYHALTTLKDPTLMAEYRAIIAATWLSFFTDQSNCSFYFQSEIPEIFELYWILSCFCPKGLLNRAHAYKAVVANNVENGHDPDRQINQGVFSYPVLMAADILLFHANQVPVGADQKQHVEIAGEIVNHVNKFLSNPIPKPEPLIDQTVETIVGIDGQKMSKNYNNTIPLFADSAAIKKTIGRIQTDATPMGDPLNPDACNVFKLMSYLASPSELESLRSDYQTGAIGYGHAKQRLHESYMHYFNDVRLRYDALMVDKNQLHQRISAASAPIQKVAAERLLSIKQSLGF
tara:strand:- start:815 stop:1813 length:999 start_codon:yes stop_codon:yes gene_type:complete